MVTSESGALDRRPGSRSGRHLSRAALSFASAARVVCDARAVPPTSSPRTARERVRAELTTEIKERAIRQLGEVGAPALSLRAIAREMGMSSSALFRYFPKRDALLTAVIVDTYSRLADAAEHAHDAAAGAPVLERWVAICHGVRDWSVAHPHEYALVYGSPVPGYTAPEDTAAPAWRVPRLLTGLLVEIAGERPAGTWP